MKEINLNCFENFKCKAGDCKNSCCIGWEIEIDKKTLKKYKRVKGEFGKKIKQGIDKKQRVFKKDDCRRCVFLNKDNLCEIFLNLGENALCDVCRVHPRYKCFLTDRIEWGIGLSCEEGVNLLFNYPNEIKEVVTFDDNTKEVLSDFEKEALSFRKEITDILTDISLDFSQKVKRILQKVNLKESDFFAVDYKNLLLGLEPLDKDWHKLVGDSSFAKSFDFAPSFDKKNERLAVYFMYRHLLTAIDGLDLITKTLFSVLSVYVINVLYQNKKLPFEELCRKYSAEIEYSSENLNAVFDLLDGVAIKTKIGE